MYVFTHVRTDGTAHTLKCEGYGAESVCDREFNDTTERTSTLYAAVIDSSGTVRRIFNKVRGG